MKNKQSISIQIEPCSKPRMTRSDKWKKRKCVLEYRAFCDELRLKLRNFELKASYKITFGLPFPATYPKKKRELLNGKPHQIKPDLDNLLKAFNDALCEDDSFIHETHAKKVWAEKGFIEIGENCIFNE